MESPSGAHYLPAAPAAVPRNGQERARQAPGTAPQTTSGRCSRGGGRSGRVEPGGAIRSGPAGIRSGDADDVAGQPAACPDWPEGVRRARLRCHRPVARGDRPLQRGERATVGYAKK